MKKSLILLAAASLASYMIAAQVGSATGPRVGIYNATSVAKVPPVPGGSSTDDPTTPSSGPSEGPSCGPSCGPSEGPSSGPSSGPSEGPSSGPSEGPSSGPSEGPSSGPSEGPSSGPSEGPSSGPSEGPSSGPSEGPSSGPSEGPGEGPSEGPGEGPSGPSEGPGEGPSGPSEGPGEGPTEPEDDGTKGVEADYSAIVTKGDVAISWETSQLYPFSIEGTTAKSSNQGLGNTVSWVAGSFTAEGHVNLAFTVTSSSEIRLIDRWNVNQDITSIEIDGVLVWSSGNQEEYKASVELSEGEHTFKVAYTKDATVDEHHDCATIADVELVTLPNDFSVLGDGDENFSYGFVDGKAQWTCYSGVARPNAYEKESAFNITADKESAYSLVFDYTLVANEGAFKVYVDGASQPALDLTGRKYGKFVEYFPEGGNHTVTCVYEGVQNPLGQDEVLDITNLKCCDFEYTVDRKEYTAIMRTQFDEDLKWDASAYNLVNFNTTFTYYHDGEVVIDSLMCFKAGIMDQYPIRTRIENNKITLSTILNTKEGTLIGVRHDDPYNYGPNMDAVLACGTYDGEHGWLYQDNEIVLEVSEDRTNVVAPKGLGFYDYYVGAYYPEACYTVLVDGPQLVVPETLTAKTMHVGQSTKLDLTISNNGASEAQYTITIPQSEYVTFECETTGVIAPMGARVVVPVKITCDKDGAYSETFIVKDQVGNETKVVVNGEVLPSIDYADIVAEGKDAITWTSSEDYPWDVVYGEAFSTNKGANGTTSWLEASFTVPSTSIAIFSGVGIYSVGSDNFNIYVNEELVQQYKTTNFFTADYDYSFEYRCKPGEYKIRFEYARLGNGSTNGLDQVSLHDVTLQMEELLADNAEISTDVIDFGNISSRSEYRAKVTLTNLGANDLTINSITGDEVFSGVLPETSASTLEDLTFDIICNTPKDGEFEGTVVVNTTVGKFTIQCSAVAENVVKFGDGIQTGMYYPCYPPLFHNDQVAQSLYIDERLSALKDCKITSITFFLIDYVAAETTWTDAHMTWEVGATTAESLYVDDAVVVPEGLTTVYDGETLNYADRKLTVEFDKPLAWDGSDHLMYRLSITNSQEQNGWVYNKATNTTYVASTITANDGTVYINTLTPDMLITYELPGTSAIETIEISSAAVESVEYFTLEGIKVDNPNVGVNIVHTRYADGRVTSHKVLVK